MSNTQTDENWPPFADMLLELVGKEKLAWADVATRLNKSGHKTVSGAKFAPHIVARMYPKLAQEKKRKKWRDSKRASYQKDKQESELAVVNRALAASAEPVKAKIALSPRKGETTESFVTRVVLDVVEGLQSFGIHLTDMVMRDGHVRIAYCREISVGSGVPA
jgi:hypothetical protein